MKRIKTKCAGNFLNKIKISVFFKQIKVLVKERNIPHVKKGTVRNSNIYKTIYVSKMNQLGFQLTWILAKTSLVWDTVAVGGRCVLRPQ